MLAPDSQWCWRCGWRSANNVGFFYEQFLKSAEGLLNDNAFGIEFIKAGRVSLHFRSLIVCQVLIGSAAIFVEIWMVAGAAIWIFGSDFFGSF